MKLLRKYYDKDSIGGGIPDEDIIRKHVKAYYYHKDRQLNDDDILPIKRVRAIVNELNHTHSEEISRLKDDNEFKAKLLNKCNSVLRSTHSICLRKGQDTFWDSFTKVVEECLNGQLWHYTEPEIYRQQIKKIQDENAKLKAENERLRGALSELYDVVFKGDNVFKALDKAHEVLNKPNITIVQSKNK